MLDWMKNFVFVFSTLVLLVVVLWGALFGVLSIWRHWGSNYAAATVVGVFVLYAAVGITNKRCS